MKREIKFRAWAEIRNEVLGMKYNVPHNYNNYVMQYTGLKDKNGKDIYEGDIIKAGKDICVVSFSIKFASFTIEKIGWLHSHYFGEAFEADECEVIGNIYEDSHLLK